MSPPTSPLFESVPKWFGPRGRKLISLKYVYRLTTLFLIFVLFGVSLVRMYGSTGTSDPNASLSPAYQHDPNAWGSASGEVAGQFVDVSREDVVDATADDHEPPKPFPSSPTTGTSTGRLKPAAKSLYDKISEKLSGFKMWKGKEAAPRDKAAAAFDFAEDISTPETHAYGERPYLGKVTITTSGKSDDVYERALRTHVAHNRLHNYEMFTLRHNILSDRTANWGKLAYILHVLLRELTKPPSERLQWLVWVDTDTVILNPRIPFEIFLPPAGWDDIHLLVNNDFNGLNNGIFLIRVHPWSVDLMTASLAWPDFHPAEDLRFLEQSAMEEVLRVGRFRKHSLQLPQRWFNAYPGEADHKLEPHQLHRGDLLVHFAGFFDRDERMTSWLLRAEEHDPEWEVELKYTSYPREVKEFYANAAKERTEGKTEAVTAMKEAKDELQNIDYWIGIYAGQLDEEAREELASMRKNTSKLLEKEEHDPDVQSVKELMDALRKTAKPLLAIVSKANQHLLKEAHDLLYRVEQESFFDFSRPETVKETEEVEEAIFTLKKMVMAKHVQPVGLQDAVKSLREKFELLQHQVTKHGVGNSMEEIAKIDDQAGEENEVKEGEDEKAESDA